VSLMKDVTYQARVGTRPSAGPLQLLYSYRKQRFFSVK
jgi:hypothetical protein